MIDERKADSDDATDRFLGQLAIAVGLRFATFIPPRSSRGVRAPMIGVWLATMIVTPRFCR